MVADDRERGGQEDDLHRCARHELVLRGGEDARESGVDVRGEHRDEHESESARRPRRGSMPQQPRRARQLKDARDGHEQAGSGQAGRHHADEFRPHPNEMRNAGRHEHGRETTANGDRPGTQPADPGGARHQQHQCDDEQNDQRSHAGPPPRGNLSTTRLTPA